MWIPLLVMSRRQTENEVFVTLNLTLLTSAPYADSPASLAFTTSHYPGGTCISFTLLLCLFYGLSSIHPPSVSVPYGAIFYSLLSHTLSIWRPSPMLKASTATSMPVTSSLWFQLISCKGSNLNILTTYCTSPFDCLIGASTSAYSCIISPSKSTAPPVLLD